MKTRAPGCLLGIGDEILLITSYVHGDYLINHWYGILGGSSHHGNPRFLHF